MTQMTVALSAKNLQKEISYNNPHKIIKNEQNTPFTVEKLAKEVKNLNKTSKKKLKRICEQFLMTSTSFFTLVTPTLAATNSQTEKVMPNDILQAGMWIISIMTVTSFVLTIVLLQSAAVYKMIFKKKKKIANEWSEEVLRGFSQVMLAPALVTTIALTMYLLFNGLEWFVSPLSVK